MKKRNAQLLVSGEQTYRFHTDMNMNADAGEGTYRKSYHRCVYTFTDCIYCNIYR